MRIMPWNFRSQIYLIYSTNLLGNRPLEEQKTIWSPRLWTPSAQNQQSLLLHESTKDILAAIKNEKIGLEAVSWRQLENIVAEILRAHGLEIHVVRENPQGGRDIIARGELIPGQEPVLLAVEVKHRKNCGPSGTGQGFISESPFSRPFVCYFWPFHGGSIKRKSATREPT